MYKSLNYLSRLLSPRGTEQSERKTTRHLMALTLLVITMLVPQALYAQQGNMYDGNHNWIPVGNSQNNSTTYYQNHSNTSLSYHLPSGYKMHFEFANYHGSGDSNNDHNWQLLLLDDNGNFVVGIRPDWWWWTSDKNQYEVPNFTVGENNWVNWDGNFNSQMENAYVTMDITYEGGLATIYTQAFRYNGNTKGSEIYHQTFYYNLLAQYGWIPSTLHPRLVVNYSHLDVFTDTYKIEELGASSSPSLKEYNFERYAQCFGNNNDNYGYNLSYGDQSNNLYPANDACMEGQFSFAGGPDNHYWKIGANSGLYAQNNNQPHFAINNLSAGDVVTVYGYGGWNCLILETNNMIEGKTIGNQLYFGQQYKMTSSGTLELSGGQYSTITKVTIEGSEDVVVNEDYNNATSVGDWKSPTASGDLTIAETNGNKYVKFEPSTERGARSAFNSSLTSGGKSEYVFEFDACIKGGTLNATQLAVLTEDIGNNNNAVYTGINFLFKLDQTTMLNSQSQTTTYTINGTTTEVTLGNNTWYHYKLTVNTSTPTVQWVITNKDNGYSYVASGTYGPEGNTEIVEVYFCSGRAYAHGYFDNLKVYGEKKVGLYFKKKSAEYELITLDFQEPELVVYPTGAKVTFSSSNEKVAKIGNQTTGDLMFVNTGTTTITATAIIDGVEYSDSYTVLAKADEAIWKVENGNTVYFPETNEGGQANNDNTGKLLKRKVTSVPFMEMHFGDADNPNMTMVRNYNGTRATMTLDEDGWEHMYFLLDENNNIKPTQGTFYTFKPDIDGTLTIRGLKKQYHGNDVILVDADATEGERTSYNPSGNNIGDATYKMAIGETHEAGDMVEVKDNNNVVVATLQFGVSGGADFSAATSDSQVSGYTAYTAGNGENGTANSGTVYTIVPKYSGLIEVAVVLNAGKKFYILQDEVPMTGFDEVTKSEKYYGTFTFMATANKTYKIYCTGSKLGFYGVTFKGNTTYTSYPIVEKLTFNGDVANEQEVDLIGGHTYYLYANTSNSNGVDDWNVFYLSGFTFETDFEFAEKAVLLVPSSDVSGKVNYGDFHREANTGSYTQTVTQHNSGNIHYSAEAKGGISFTNIDDQTGEITGITGEGSIVVTAAFTPTNSDKSFKTYYVITVPYTTDSQTPEADGTKRIKWKFWETSDIENKQDLQANANADEWGITYKVRTYDSSTRSLNYLNVPVLCNNVSIDGDNARYIDATRGLLFKAEAHDFGTDVEVTNKKNELSAEEQAIAAKVDSVLKIMLAYTPDMEEVHETTNYIAMYNGSSMTIPNLKAGQYVRIKWKRYAAGQGEFMRLYNLNDLNDKQIPDGEGIYIGQVAGTSGAGRGYMEFRVREDGDVSFLLDQKGWTNFSIIEVCDEFMPNDLSLKGTDAKLVYIRQKGSEAATATYDVSANINRQSSLGTVTYGIKDDSRTGTLTTSNTTVSDLTMTSDGHGRFTLVQDCATASDGYVLDRKEYEIKMYEYDYTEQTYPYTWDAENMVTTGNDLQTSGTDYPFWSAADSDGFYTMNIGYPENVICWNKQDGSGNEIAELSGLGIIPTDITDASNTNIKFNPANGGIKVMGDIYQKLRVPKVASGAKLYLLIDGGNVASDSEGTEMTKTNGAYVVEGTGEDVDIYLKGGAVVKKVAVANTFIAFNDYEGKGYTTAYYPQNVRFDLCNAFTGTGVTAQAVTGSNINSTTESGTLTLTDVAVANENTPLLLTASNTGIKDENVMPLFVKDVNSELSTISGTNYLVGATSRTTVPTGSYILTNKYRDVVNGQLTGETKEGKLAWYKVYGTNYVKANGCYLTLPASSNGARVYYFFDWDDDVATGIDAAQSELNEQGEQGEYFNLSGQKINGKPAQKGIYVKNGKKVFVK